MRSEKPGKRTSSVEVTNVSPHGFWLLLDGREKFIAFELFPWFREAAIGDLVHVERPRAGHLSWPALDVDLAVESIEHPGRFPLVSRPQPKKHERRIGVGRPVAERKRRRPA